MISIQKQGLWNAMATSSTFCKREPKFPVLISLRHELFVAARSFPERFFVYSRYRDYVLLSKLLNIKGGRFPNPILILKRLNPAVAKIIIRCLKKISGLFQIGWS